MATKLETACYTKLGWKLTPFWCDTCDIFQVNPADPSTGTFYRASGHVLNYKTKQVKDYKTVIYAICTECDKATN